jgi:hypothetical protein
VNTRVRLASAFAVVGLLLLIAPAALADGATTITQRSRQVDVNPGETNPCNGSTGTITDDEQDVFHITTLPDGTYRLTGHSTAEVTFEPDDPAQPSYTGHETFSIEETSSSQTITTTLRSRVRVRGTDGSSITIGELVHFTLSASGIVVAFEKPTFICS